MEKNRENTAKNTIEKAQNDWVFHVTIVNGAA
jgi:hypothetical protein